MELVIIDDSILLASAYELYLTGRGHKVSMANDGQTGLDMIVFKKPELVILDMLMPGMNGIELLEKLRKTSGVSKTRVIVLSNIDNEELRQAAQKLGVVDYLLKIDYPPAKLALYLETKYKQ